MYSILFGAFLTSILSAFRFLLLLCIYYFSRCPSRPHTPTLSNSFVRQFIYILHRYCLGFLLALYKFSTPRVTTSNLYYRIKLWFPSSSNQLTNLNHPSKYMIPTPYRLLPYLYIYNKQPAHPTRRTWPLKISPHECGASNSIPRLPTHPSGRTCYVTLPSTSSVRNKIGL